MGRPYKNIDKEEFEKLCEMQCTQEEICGWFNADDKTLSAWCDREYDMSFSEVFKQKKGNGKISLRRKGFQMAHDIPSVHIFYAKNFLNMRDNPEQQGNGSASAIADFITKLSRNDNEKTD